MNTEERQVDFSLFGREEILARLDQRLEALKKGYRQNMGLVGPRFIGKTHLLRQFLQKIRKDQDLISIYISLKVASFDDLLERWLGSLLRGFLASRGVAFPEEFQLLVKTCRVHIPKTLDRMREVKKHAFQKKTALAFRELLGLTAVLREETGQKVVLILDEFQALDLLEVADPFGLFGKEMMIQKDTFYLATSSEPRRTKEIFHERLSLLFGNFEILEVRPLRAEVIREWVKRLYSDLAIPEEDLHLLMHLFNNHPHYFDLFLQAAKILALQKNQTAGSGASFSWNREFLVEAMTATLFSDRGLLNLHFQFELQRLTLLGRDAHTYAKTLVAVANGRVKTSQIAAYLGKKGSETQKILQRLAGEGILEKSGSFYYLPDPLFRFWLRHVFQVKERDLDPGQERARAIFQNRLRDEFRKMEEEDRMDLTERVEILFRQFRNDVVELRQKKVKCPAFLEIASRPTNGRFFPILGRTTQDRWVCQVFRDPIVESDVASFTEELKQSRRKVQRKIIVALGGIELNAKLMAQEAKVQVWDLENFNALLELYGRLKVLI